MKVTKFGHACLALEEQGQKLIIDPGTLSPTIGDLHGVVGVVATHVHADHLSIEHVKAIIAANPDVQIFGTQEVADACAKENIQNARAVSGGDTAAAGIFSLQFFGEKHALIHEDYPQNQNVGVLVSKNLYYPGDSFTLPEGATVQTLALPVSGPWLKIGESMDLYQAVRPKICFPTHNALLSEVGENMVDNWIGNVAKQDGAIYKSLKPGDSLDI